MFVAEKVSQRQPDVCLHDLQVAWMQLMKKARLTRHHTVAREELSVREHMSAIMRQLSPARYTPFADLFDPAAGVPVLVVNFLAILELVKEKLVELSQSEAFAPIYVRLAHES